MGTKADFIAAMGGAATLLGGDSFTATNATNRLTVTGHGRTDGDGPLQLSNTGGQLPTGLTPFRATNGLTFTPGTIADDVVEVAGVYYQWAADPTAGTPDGSATTPYLVDVGTDDEASLANLLAAINASGTPGTTYSAEITGAHASVEATASDATSVSLRALAAGTGGNALTLSVSGDDGVAADAATFSGGLAAVGYYVRVVDANTIELALTQGGSAVAFTDDGTGTHTIGGSAQGLADALESILSDHLTAPGNRSMPATLNISKTWDSLIAAAI